MTGPDIARQRLHNQRISQPTFDQPVQVVAWMGAMQAQDYSSAKWGIGLRYHGATDAGIEQAIADRTILRTWLLRGTLHFVAAADVRWMLALLAERLIAGNARRDRQLELDAATYARSLAILTKALEGGKCETRKELMRILEQEGVSTGGQRGYHILARAALEGLICFGPQQGKEQTFVLLDEWAPAGKHLKHDEALAELAGRYFSSHGPATLQDFTWWSGLPAAEARSGLESIARQLRSATVGNQIYWFQDNPDLAAGPSPVAYLLPAFDEYYLGYTQRAAILDPHFDRQVVSSNGLFRPMLVIDGQVVGVWRREVKKAATIIQPVAFRPLSAGEKQVLALAAERYEAFLETTVTADLTGLGDL